MKASDSTLFHAAASLVFLYQPTSNQAKVIASYNTNVTGLEFEMIRTREPDINEQLNCKENLDANSVCLQDG